MTGRILIPALVVALLASVACGGGGSNNSGGGNTPVNNVQPVNSTLGVTGNYADGLFTSVTVCVPGTANCQAITNVLVDTGSYGLRLIGPQVNISLPQAKDTSGNALGECTQYQDSFTWGPVVTADIQIAGETAKAVPMQLLGASGFPAAPSGCTGTGLAENDTQATLGANGILGVGVFRFDCGDGCAPPQTTIPPVYFDCPSAGCAPTLVSDQDQVQNPVWLFPQDNNGVVIAMPSVGATGAPSAAGTMTFGIGTRSNNALGAATVLATDNNGNLATSFQGTNYTGTILDSGSNGIFFLDDKTLNIPLCADGNSGFYCPTAPVSFSATNQSAAAGGAASTAPAQWTIANAQDLFNTGNATFINLGGPNPGGFDFGLPFFLGRSVFVAINGQSVGSITGPFFAY